MSEITEVCEAGGNRCFSRRTPFTYVGTCHLTQATLSSHSGGDDISDLFLAPTIEDQRKQTISFLFCFQERVVLSREHVDNII